MKEELKLAKAVHESTAMQLTHESELAASMSPTSPSDTRKPQATLTKQLAQLRRDKERLKTDLREVCLFSFRMSENLRVLMSTHFRYPKHYHVHTVQPFFSHTLGQFRTD
jgi:hypothetical protein